MKRSWYLAVARSYLILIAVASVSFAEIEPCPGDLDASFAIDLADYASIANCITGPGQSLADTACLKANLHFDHHVDLRDFATFQNKFGPCQLCAPDWDKEEFCLPGLEGSVYAMTNWDDGTGLALYVGGRFTIAGCADASNIAKWNGAHWSSLGSGVGSGTQYYVASLVVFDDGNGPALYAGGRITTANGAVGNGIVRWDGANWSPLDSEIAGVPFPSVNTLLVFDDGSGSALYAGGRFSSAGGNPVNNIAKWNGVSWSPLGSGLQAADGLSAVLTLAVFDDGTGPALFAGGHFTIAGGNAINRIAKWDGISWSALGKGITGCIFSECDPPVGIKALAVFDDGGGAALYVGGVFSTAGDVPARIIAKWDGVNWTSIGSGLNYEVFSLTTFDDGTGPALFAAGSFTLAGSELVNRIAKWNGQEWHPLAEGTSRYGVYSQFVFDDGTGPVLIAGGDFNNAGGISASSIAKWDGEDWSALGTGGGLDLSVSTLVTLSDVTGTALYAGGDFTIAGNRVAKWDGAKWSSLGAGMNSTVNALASFNDGSGSAVFAGGRFNTAGTFLANKIAKWDGFAWSGLSNGMTGCSIPPPCSPYVQL